MKNFLTKDELQSAVQSAVKDLAEAVKADRGGVNCWFCNKEVTQETVKFVKVAKPGKVFTYPACSECAVKADLTAVSDLEENEVPWDYEEHPSTKNAPKGWYDAHCYFCGKETTELQTVKYQEGNKIFSCSVCSECVAKADLAADQEG